MNGFFMALIQLELASSILMLKKESKYIPGQKSHKGLLKVNAQASKLHV